MSDKEFGKLRLSVESNNSDSGFDIQYDFGESLNFVEFTSKPVFSFIQPWMQFPSKQYSDTCKLVAIELVHRFNEYPKLAKQAEEHEDVINNMHESYAKQIKYLRTELGWDT